MLFSSITFLYVVLPVVVLVYFLTPDRGKNYVLLAASLIFYAWGEPVNLWVMIAEIALCYLSGLAIEKYREKAAGKIFLGASLLVNIGFLVYFKYTDFFLQSFGELTGMSVKLLRIALPIGISFYTFQLISYSVDVYRGTVRAQRNPFLLATYGAMFPQLIAGPIVRYGDVEQQLRSRVHSFDQAALGIRRFVLGLSKKVLIANALGELCEIFRASTDLSVGYCWLYAVAFTLHIYYDFSGYSDMAIGLGRIFGFELLENFHYPYCSKSITEFWRRWHMSLGTWFRDYVYIPLGGNRVSGGRWIFNVLIVWFLTGFWHGASWNFIVWGLYFAVFLVLEKIWHLRREATIHQACKFMVRTVKNGSNSEALKDGNTEQQVDSAKRKTPGWELLKHLYVMFFITISFVIFNADTLGQAVGDLRCMFGLGRLPLLSYEAGYYFRSYGVILLLAVIGATPLPKRSWCRMEESRYGKVICHILEGAGLFILLILITAYLVDGSFNPFLYFRF